MKRTQKALSLALILCMLLGTALATALPGFAAVPTGNTTLTTDSETGYPKWSNDETVGWRNGNRYGTDSPFAYEYYVAPTAASALTGANVPSDATNVMGFYPMLWHEETGRYRATTTTTGGAYGGTDANIGVLACYHHIASAVSFTAPYTGKIRFTYQCWIYANADGTNQSDNGTLYISKSGLDPSNASTYLEAITMEKAESHDEAGYGVKKTVEVDVKAGEKVYFTTKNNAGALLMTVLYINSAEYIEMPVVTDSAEVIGHSLSAMDTPVINFYVKLSETAVSSDAKIRIGSDEAITVCGISAAGVIGPDGQPLTEADLVRIYSVPVSAKRMTETVTISIIGVDGQELLTSKSTYSVAEYCYAQVAAYKAAGTEATADHTNFAKVCTGILVYGRTAQQYFNYRPDSLPTVDADLLALVVAGCNPTDSLQSGADITQIPDIPDIPDTGADTAPAGEVPVGTNTVGVTSAQLLKLIEEGTIAENGDYAVTDGEGVTFGQAHNGEEFDLKNALIRIGVREGAAGITVTAKTLTLKNARIAVYGGTALAVTSANSNTTLQSIHICGNASEGFSLGGSGSTLSGCTVKPSEGGSITRAVTATGSNVMVENCSFEGTETGVADESQTGAMIRNNRFKNCTLAVEIGTANSAVWNNTVIGGAVGIRATDDKAEISACMATVYNVSVAKNTVTGAETAILFRKVSNCVAIQNTADSLITEGCINAYIMDNRVSGTLTLEGNNYIIADSNGYGSFRSNENGNTNGGNLTDLSARAAVGVNEKLLPHINCEQFAGMTGRSQFRTQYGILGLSGYLHAAIAAGETDIIVPPGAYINSAMTFTGLDNINFYGYGVYNDTMRSTATAMTFRSCTRIGLYGFFIGNSVNPNLQGTVVSVTGTAGKETISFVADPGYLANYTIASDFPATNGGGGGIYRADSLYPYSEIWYEPDSKSYDATTQTNTITLIGEGIKYGRLPSASTPSNPLAVGSINIGDRVAFRNYKGAGGISTSQCSEMKIEDVTIFNSSGFALSDYDSDVAVSLHRYAVTSGPAPVIESIKDSTLATVNDANRAVTWTDSYGRLRSAFSLTTTCDATHCTNARTGIQAVSCLLERMMDDGGNINAHYGRAVSYDAGTKTLTYCVCDVNGYQLLPADFRVGDKVELYTRKGVYVGTATATSATVQTVESSNVLNCRYTVKLSDDIVLPDDPSDVVVQNASACGNGFLWDNVMVRNNNSYGVRIQAMGGEIRNCSFIGLAKGGINMIPQYEAWPECGYACDVKILNNVFEELSIMAAQWYDWDSPEGGSSFSPICIRAPGGDSANSANCMFRNITISGNRFSSRYTYYDLVINGVSNLKVTGNTFSGRLGMENTDTQGNILLRGGNGILIDGNTFTVNADKDVVIRNGNAQNVTGSNVG